MRRGFSVFVLLVAGLPVLNAADTKAPQPATPALADCDALFGEPGLLSSDETLLAPFQNQPTCWDGWTSSVGGALRYRYIDERNRLRPPLAAGRSSYQQWRFTPYAQLKYEDLVQLYVEGIDAPTFGNDLPEVAIDQNRMDLSQYYFDLNLADLEDGGALHLKVGRQYLLYGSQHLISPLAWANTFRNFEGVKLYYSDEVWNIDAFAVQPVNGATGNAYRPYSFDHPDASRWFSGVYTTWKQAPQGTLDLYWLWLKENDDNLTLADGNRQTIGARYAGKLPIKDESGPLCSLLWDVEGAYQYGRDDLVTGLNQDIQAGFLSTNGGVALDQLPWTPTVTGIFWWGSGDDDPNDGTTNTVNTLFPLGHAYWGQIDNFCGQNLLDYGVHLTVKPEEKLTVLTGWHWFDKATRQDAIYNIAGVPFGGMVPTTDRHLGNEVDIVATYQFNKNLQLQAGYFWFWYGNAVTQFPNPLVANRKDAQQFYAFIDWTF